MKKIFLLMIVGGLCSFVASAQIQMEKTFTNDLQILGKMYVGGGFMNALGSEAPIHKIYRRVFKDQKTYGILVETSNRFDDYVDIALGTTLEEAKESVEAILNFMQTAELDTSMPITDIEGRRFQLDLIRRNWIEIQIIGYAEGDNISDVIAGSVYLNKSCITKALGIINNELEKEQAQYEKLN